MNNSNDRKYPSWLPVILVGMVAWVFALILFNRASWNDWTQPKWLSGDPLEVYARVKIASEQTWLSLIRFSSIERLGAPITANWAAYPVPDKPLFILTGSFARLVGLIPAIQLMSVVLLSINAMSFYFMARWLRWRWEWAAATALLFAFCSYNIRWGITLSFNQTYTLPPLIILCAYAAKASPSTGKNRGWLLLATVLAIGLGVGNPYLAYFSGVVGGGTLLLALLRRSPRSRQVPLLLFLGVLTFVFISANATYVWELRNPAESNLFARNKGDFELYALRPIDWIIPPADHRVGFMAKIGQDYLKARQASGEFFYNYLGIFGLIGGLGLLATFIRSVWRKTTRTADAAFALFWITLFGIHGGINSRLGEVGLDLFRASSRIAIFALIWILFFLCHRLSRLTRTWPRPLSIAAAGLLACVGCWEQTPPLGSRADRSNNAARWDSYRQLTETLEKSLPPSARIFQLPSAVFPEGGAIDTMPDYEHFLPFLTSRSLCFSYGYLPFTPIARWADFHSKQSVEKMIPTLEQSGFSALWIDDRGYPDGGEQLVANLRKLGLREHVTAPDLPIHIFFLAPIAQPTPPDLNDPRLLENWDNQPVTNGHLQILALGGWYPLETDSQRRWRWAQLTAQTGIWCDHPRQSASLTFRPDGKDNTRLRLRLNGREIWLQTITAGNTPIQKIEITIQSGLNTLEWELEGPTFQPGGQDHRKLGFMIENLMVSPR